MQSGISSNRDDRLATSGMSHLDQFAAIRDAGFEVVINLAMPTRQRDAELARTVSVTTVG